MTATIHNLPLPAKEAPPRIALIPRDETEAEIAGAIGEVSCIPALADFLVDHGCSTVPDWFSFPERLRPALGAAIALRWSASRSCAAIAEASR